MASWVGGEMQAGSKVNFTAFLNDRSQPQAKVCWPRRIFLGFFRGGGKGAWMSGWKLGSMDSKFSGLFSPTI